MKIESIVDSIGAHQDAYIFIHCHPPIHIYLYIATHLFIYSSRFNLYKPTLAMRTRLRRRPKPDIVPRPLTALEVVTARCASGVGEEAPDAVHNTVRQSNAILCAER
jgi:hypothetical protein